MTNLQTNYLNKKYFADLVWQVYPVFVAQLTNANRRQLPLTYERPDT